MKNIKAFRDIIKESQINAYNDGYKQGQLDGHEQGKRTIMASGTFKYNSIYFNPFIEQALKIYFIQLDFFQSCSERYKKKTKMTMIDDDIEITLIKEWEVERYREVFEKVYVHPNNTLFDECSSL